MIDYTKPKQVLKAYGITEPLDQAVFQAFVIGYFDARFTESMTEAESMQLLKDSCEYAKISLGRVKT